MRLILPFFAALQFLSILPPVVHREFSLPELGQSVGFFPLVGWLLGAMLWGVFILLTRFFPPAVLAVLLLTLWILFSGAIHFDGFLDMCDGLFGGRTPEARLEIMRDHRVGAFATAGGGLLLLTAFASLTAIQPARMGPALLLTPVFGRWAAAQAIVWLPYARSQGLGRAMKDHARWPQALLATLILLPAFIFWPTASLHAGLAALLMPGLILLITLRRIPGLTGDIYGAIITLTEIAVLIAFTAGAGK
ncbi:MAG: adenosylcobinamide-GDP ribazoletransferase [Clostridia bacterium]|nr:MAG: adenosylcobinamide-GDP ribazoletransferase [Clostridia bacterium]